ncbi:hypothetical protein OG874_21380 [Nocardia sp. NBC_00565]|uniref:hypothetical protein n=1 Tax=Nocardia sp. NBC_00565 TaxID=2975993 RepID=UPI002E819926|nr:hypothetical protein [Nocardia sp. NBC_00565]WUC07481.1 hypothetical protein OG874_21380 [Nocardia sp. NBC_00565]
MNNPTHSPTTRADNRKTTGIRFLAAREHLLYGPLGRGPHMGSYLEGMGHVIGGNTRWHFHTPGYNGTGYVWNGVTSGPVARYPDHTVDGDEHNRAESSCDDEAVDDPGEAAAIAARRERSAIPDMSGTARNGRWRWRW